jgi:hypothetical protein
VEMEERSDEHLRNENATERSDGARFVSERKE